MTLKEFFKHPATIIIGSILILLGIGWIGKKYWGWFASETDNGEFPTNPQLGDKFTKEGKVYVYKDMGIQCIKAPCAAGMWVLFNEGDTPSQENRTQDTNGNSANEYVSTEENYIMQEDNANERASGNGLKCYPEKGYFKDKAGNNTACPNGITYPDGTTWAKVPNNINGQCCYQKKGGGTPPPIPTSWNYESVKSSSNSLSWALVGYANKSIGKMLKVGDHIQTNPKSGIYRVDNISYASPRDYITISSAIKGNIAPPQQGSISKTILPPNPAPIAWSYTAVKAFGKNQHQFSGKSPLPVGNIKPGQTVNIVTKSSKIPATVSKGQQGYPSSIVLDIINQKIPIDMYIGGTLYFI